MSLMERIEIKVTKIITKIHFGKFWCIMKNLFTIIADFLKVYP